MGHLCFVSLFPEYFETAMRSSILGRAIARGKLSYSFIQIREFSTVKHHRVDDAPYGGGAGQVMMPGPIVSAIERARESHPGIHMILTSPQGCPFNQATARRISRGYESVGFVCGHYEGVDERVRAYVDEELSIGDYVLTGGELAAAVMGDAIARLWPGVLGNDESSVEESFTEGWLEYPQYTRPVEFRGERVPEILMGGNHEAIARWRRAASIRRTELRRPEIYARLVETLSQEDKILVGLAEPPQKRRRRKKSAGQADDDPSKST